MGWTVNDCLMQGEVKVFSFHLKKRGPVCGCARLLYDSTLKWDLKGTAEGICLVCSQTSDMDTARSVWRWHFFQKEQDEKGEPSVVSHGRHK